MMRAETRHIVWQCASPGKVCAIFGICAKRPQSTHFKVDFLESRKLGLKARGSRPPGTPPEGHFSQAGGKWGLRADAKNGADFPWGRTLPDVRAYSGLDPRTEEIWLFVCPSIPENQDNEKLTSLVPTIEKF